MPKEWKDLHDKLKEENPEMSDSMAYALATNIYKKRHDGRTPRQDAPEGEKPKSKTTLEKKVANDMHKAIIKEASKTDE